MTVTSFHSGSKATVSSPPGLMTLMGLIMPADVAASKQAAVLPLAQESITASTPFS